MRITKLSLRNFRNHVESVIECAPHLNLVTGPNGAGKTSLIDAIHYLCMSRSFVSSSDRYVVTEGETWFMIDGGFEGAIRTSFEVGFSWSSGDGKKIFVNRSPLDRISELIGMVPVVVLCPADKSLTDDGPAARRTFIDGFISQISSPYLRELIRYNRVRSQRNRLLQDHSGSLQALAALLEPWDRQLIESGSRIVAMRTKVLSKLSGYLEAQFGSLSGVDLQPGLAYRTFCEPNEDPEVVGEKFAEELSTSLAKELEREQTLTGPHRDEIVFYLDDMELRNYGSEGQHRLFLVALKMAQLFYYSDELDDLPIMLLDDLFGSLDPARTEMLLLTLQNHPGQTFITSASSRAFDGIDWSRTNGNALFEIDRGKIIRNS